MSQCEAYLTMRKANASEGVELKQEGQGEEPAGTDSRRTYTPARPFSEARLLRHADPRSRIIKDL